MKSNQRQHLRMAALLDSNANANQDKRQRLKQEAMAKLFRILALKAAKQPLQPKEKAALAAFLGPMFSKVIRTIR
jgi:hypothetical protein